MSKKTINFFTFILLSIISRISTIEIIPKYGKKTINDDEALLDVSDFDSGDKIYISITATYSGYSTKLCYKFYDSFASSFNCNQYADWSSSTSSYSTETYNYKIKKNNSNSKYLYMSYQFTPPVTIENTEDDSTVTVIIIVVVVFVVVVVVVIIIICCCCKRCRARRYGAVPYPGFVGYGVTPYAVQPVISVIPSTVQPVVNVQPYYNSNPQYNQVAPAPIGSEVRVNQNQL